MPVIWEYADQAGERGGQTASMPGIKAAFCSLPPGETFRAPGEAQSGWEAVFCLTGRLQAELTGGRVLEAGPGELLLADTAQVTACTVTLGPAELLTAVMDWREMTLPFVTPSELDRLLRQIEGRGGCLVCRDPLWGGSLRTALRRLTPERYGAYFALRLLERLYVLCREPLEELNAQDGYFDSYQRDVLKRVHDYLMQHPEQPSTIQTLAREFQISPTALKQGFRRIYGKPVHAYLQQLRLQKAAHLLCTTSETVLTIATRVGYAGTSCFNTAFKAAYHVTPMQYRRMHPK